MQYRSQDKNTTSLMPNLRQELAEMYFKVVNLNLRQKF